MLRPRVKRASAVIIVNAVSNPAQIFSSYLYADETAPRYVLAMSVNSAFAFDAILLALTMQIFLQHANKKLANGAEVAAVMKGEPQKEIAGISENERQERKPDKRPEAPPPAMARPTMKPVEVGTTPQIMDLTS